MVSSFSWFSFMSSIGHASNICAESFKDDLAREFQAAGATKYVNYYNKGIIYFSGWVRMVQLHLSSIKPGSIHIIDAGSGTGRVAQKINEFLPNSIVHLFERSADMARYTSENGISSNRTHISDITDLRINGVKLGDGQKFQIQVLIMF